MACPVCVYGTVRALNVYMVPYMHCIYMGLAKPTCLRARACGQQSSVPLFYANQYFYVSFLYIYAYSVLTGGSLVL